MCGESPKWQWKQERNKRQCTETSSENVSYLNLCESFGRKVISKFKCSFILIKFKFGNMNLKFWEYFGNHIYTLVTLPKGFSKRESG